MTRAVYVLLIQLHPPEFRRAFGEQMLCIFDEMAADGVGNATLYADALISLARQWILRTGLWIPCVAIIASAALFAMFPLWRPRIRPWMIPENPGSDADAGDLIKLTLLSMGLISFILAATVAWSHSVHNRRRTSCHSNYARSRNVTAAYPRFRT